MSSFDSATDTLFIGDVGLNEPVTWIVQNLRERRQVAGVGELVDRHDPVRSLANEQSYDGRANEAGPASDEYGFHDIVAPGTMRSQNSASPRGLPSSARGWAEQQLDLGGILSRVQHVHVIPPSEHARSGRGDHRAPVIDHRDRGVARQR